MKTKMRGSLLLLLVLLLVMGWSAVAAGAESASQCEKCHGSVVQDFFYPNVKKAFPNTDGRCKKCHDDPQFLWYMSTSNKYIEGYGYFNTDDINVLAQRVAKYNLFHGGDYDSGHAGRTAYPLDPDLEGCNRCHGQSWYKQLSNNDIQLTSIAFPNGRLMCTSCHYISEVPHSSHGGQVVTGKMADGSTYSLPKSLSCLSTNCHGNPLWTQPAGTIIGNWANGTGNTWPLTRRADGKELCVNCHNVDRNGYEIDSTNGHGTNLTPFHTFTDYNAVYDTSYPTMYCGNCHVYKDPSGNKVEAKTDIAAYHYSVGAREGSYDFTTNNCTTCHSNNPTPKAIDGATTLNQVIIDHDKNRDEANRRCTACHDTHPLFKTQDLINQHNTTFPTLAGYTINCFNCHTTNNMYYAHLHENMTYLYNDDCVKCHASPKFSKGNPCTVCHNNPNNDDWERNKQVIHNGNATCTSCHTTMHQGYSTQHNGTFPTTPAVDCSKCHTSALDQEHLSRGQNCNTCHDNSLPMNGSTLKDLVKQSAIRNDGSMKNCADCHTSIHPDSQLDTAHASTYVPEPNVNCGNCHLSSLHKEHARRKDSNGQPLNCNTCHSSTNPQVVNAIAQKNTLCTACHSEIHPNPGTYHTSSYVANPQVDCSKCHNNDLTLEHSNRGLNCNTCHSSTNAKVLDAISNKQTNCDACHGAPHPNPGSFHGSSYVSNPQVDCSKCHKSDLTVEHSNRGFNCNTCHTSTDPKVTGAIDKGQKDCNICHSTIHPNLASAHASPYIPNPAINCADCHNSNLTVEHSNRGLNCNSCHTSTDPKVVSAIRNKDRSCSACHATPIHADVDKPHSSSFVSNPQLNCNSCHSPVLTTEHKNRGLNCATCHSSPDSRVKAAISNKRTNCDACHSIHPDDTTVHQVGVMVPNAPIDCTKCHAPNLKLEHLNRRGSDGQLLTCATCHDSSRPDVRAAISGGVKSCNACHQIHPDPDTLHQSTFVANRQLDCSSCHRSSLTAEHSARKDNNGSPYGCATCHDSSRPDVQGAISSGNTSCSACHVISHNDPTSLNTLHLSNFVAAPAFDCGGCHSPSLSEEHLRRYDSSGRPYTCGTCHDNPRVRPIINRDFAAASLVVRGGRATSCNLCHAIHPDINDAHWRQYWFDSNSRCLNCHVIHPKN